MFSAPMQMNMMENSSPPVSSVPSSVPEQKSDLMDQFAGLNIQQEEKKEESNMFDFGAPQTNATNVVQSAPAQNESKVDDLFGDMGFSTEQQNNEINKGTFDSYFDPFAGTESSN